MKTKSILFTLLCLVALAFTSCKDGGLVNEALAIAPKDMAGKTLKVDGVTIQFKNNSSATISDYIGTAQRSSVSYKRTSELTADLSFSYHSEDDYSMSERSYTMELTFADEKQGLATGSYTYKLTISKGTKYESSDSGSKSFTNKIFNVN